MSKRVIKLTDYYISLDGKLPKKAMWVNSEFRDVVLIPAMQGNDTVVLDMRNALINNEIFAEVVIGGLLHAGYSKIEILDKIDFLYDDYDTFYPINCLLNNVDRMLMHITGVFTYTLGDTSLHGRVFRRKYLPTERHPFYISVQDLTDATVAYLSEVCCASEGEARKHIKITDKNKKNLEDLINAVT